MGSRVGIQPFTDADLARSYFRRLPDAWRDGIDEDEYVAAALALAALYPDAARVNDAAERRQARRDADPGFDRAERLREHKAICDAQAAMRIEAARRSHEVTLTNGGRTLTAGSTMPAITVASSGRGTSREQGRGRRVAAARQGDSGDDPGSSDSDEPPALARPRRALRRALSDSRGVVMPLAD